MPVAFDGTTLTIRLDTSTLSYTAQEIYSRWKEWVLTSDNAKWPPAFAAEGGAPAGLGALTPRFFFVRNDLGWRVIMPEANINTTIDGNFLPRDPQSLIDADEKLVNEPAGQFSPTVSINLTEVVELDLSSIQTSLDRLMKAYGMVSGATFKMPPSTGGEVLEDGQPIADVSGDCTAGFTVTGR